HCHPGTSVVGRSAVDQPRDSRMLEPRENLALLPEAGEHLVGVEPALDQLERDGLLEMTIGPRGAADRPHAAPSDLALDAPWTDALAARVGESVRSRGVDV